MFKKKHEAIATVQGAASRSADAIEKAEQEIQRFKSELAEMETDPTAEKWCVEQMRSDIRGMEEKLSQMRVNHGRFVDAQRKPSPAFRRGVSA